MKALVFQQSMPRLAATRLLSFVSRRAYVGPLAPIQPREIPAPELLADDWLVIRTRLCGVCGSDIKQVFLNGSLDNPMTALISFPQVLGHEVVGVVERVGPAVRSRRVGERVVLNPWLSCAPRRLPPCESCKRGELAQCRNQRAPVERPESCRENQAGSRRTSRETDTDTCAGGTRRESPAPDDIQTRP